jgi:hypothetical protein
LSKKTTHWVWEPYSTERGMAFATEISGLTDEQLPKVERGERLARVPRIVIAETTPGRFYDQLGSYTVILFVSPALRKVLEETPGTNIQFIPARVRGKGDLRYDAVNVLDKAPALDLEKSKVTRLPGSTGIDRILRFVARPIPETAPPIFHVAEEPTLVLVRDDLKSRLEAASDHAGRFTPINKYRL